MNAFAKSVCERSCVCVCIQLCVHIQYIRSMYVHKSVRVLMTVSHLTFCQ